MKRVLKIFFALCIATLWFLFSGNKEMSIIFFCILFFAFFFRPFENNSSLIQEQYLEKLKENLKKRQEVDEQLKREKNTTHKDLRKKENKN